jgi:hypothetical protein
MFTFKLASDFYIGLIELLKIFIKSSEDRIFTPCSLKTWGIMEDLGQTCDEGKKLGNAPILVHFQVSTWVWEFFNVEFNNKGLCAWKKNVFCLSLIKFQMFEGIKFPRFLCECKFGKAKGKKIGEVGI